MLTFEPTILISAIEFKQISAGPSLAVSVGMANTGFYFCGVRSWQDTVYIGKKGNAYLYMGEIAGMTDFFYGFGTAWVQSAKVALKDVVVGLLLGKGRIRLRRINMASISVILRLGNRIRV